MTALRTEPINPPLRDGQTVFCAICHCTHRDAEAVPESLPFTFICRPCLNAGKRIYRED